MTGTPSRKTEPHQKDCSSRPPTTGPIEAPTRKASTHTEVAVERWRGSGNRVRIRARVDGARVAPATPSAARAAMSMPGPVAKAATSEATVKAAAPSSRSRRRPMRSPTAPIVMSSPATMNG